MGDALKEYVEEHGLNIPNILKAVDDYSIYAHYLGFEPELYTKYSSPLRDGDNDPSFVLYESKYKEGMIMFKDMATGKYGGVFKFLMELLETDLRSVLMQINKDFGIGLAGESTENFVAKKVTKLKVVKHSTKMWVTTREPSQEFLDFWRELDISRRVQDMYFAKDTILIHYENSDYKVQVTPKSLCISYEILGHYKTYQPKGERKYKFRNDYPAGFVEGARQLKFNKDFAIITKSTKECMWFREHFDIDAVAGTSENTMISDHFMNNYLKSKFSCVYIMLDSDEAGINAQKKYIAKYPWLKSISMKEFGDTKDITDAYKYMKSKGRQEEVLDFVRSTFV